MHTRQRDMCASTHSAVYMQYGGLLVYEHCSALSSAVVYVLQYSCVLVTVLGRIFQHPASPGVVGMDGRTRATSLSGKMV